MAATGLTTAQAIASQAPKELAWAGSLLKLDLTTLDQLASGAVFCQLIDVIYNGMVPMDKVNWTSDKTTDFVANFELLKAVFTKFAIAKELSVERLVSGDRADLFGLLQWTHVFSFSTRNLGKGYDPVARRFGNEPNFAFVDKIRSKNQETDAFLLQNSGDMKQEALPLSNKENKLNMSAGAIGLGFVPGGVFGVPAGGGFRVANLESQIVQKLAQFDTIQKENEFYLNKLKEIDLVLDTFKNGTVEGIVQTIKQIINLPQEKIGFVTEDGRFQLYGSVNSQLLAEPEQLDSSKMQTEPQSLGQIGLHMFDKQQNLSANFGGSIGHSGKPRAAGFLGEEEEGGMANFDLLAEQTDGEN